MDELISRQAAIEAIEESRRLNHHKDGKEACAHEYEHRHFLKLLGDLPAAQPEPRWIPVDGKERLPRDGQRVLITDEDGLIDVAYFIDFSSIDESAEWWSHDFQCHPIAWSELPKPYERSEE